MASAGVDSSQLLALELSDRSGDSVGEQLLIAHDRGQGRPQLVRHHCQKIRLAVVGTLRFRPRCFRLAPQPFGVCARLLLERQQVYSLLVGVAQHAGRPQYKSDKSQNGGDAEERDPEFGFVDPGRFTEHPDDAEHDRRKESGGKEPSRQNAGGAFVHQQRRDAALGNGHHHSNAQSYDTDGCRQRHSRRLRQSVHPFHAEDISEQRDQADKKSWSREHLRPQVVFALIVRNREQPQRVEQKTPGGVQRYASCRIQ